MFKKDTNIAGIETVIGIVTEELVKTTPGSTEFDKLSEQLDRLNKIASSRKSDPVSKDGLLAILANITGIALIINHERLNVITSKAIGFIAKSRI